MNITSILNSFFNRSTTDSKSKQKRYPKSIKEKEVVDYAGMEKYERQNTIRDAALRWTEKLIELGMGNSLAFTYFVAVNPNQGFFSASVKCDIENPWKFGLLVHFLDTLKTRTDEYLIRLISSPRQNMTDFDASDDIYTTAKTEIDERILCRSKAKVLLKSVQ